MSTNFKANPVVAKNFTRPGESSEYVGTRNVVGLLPSIFRTNVNTQFLNSTLEQLMTSGSLQAINSYIGSSKIGMPVTDGYVDSVSKYQFAPGVVNKDSSNNVTGTLTYDDMLNALKFNDAQIEQPNRALNELGYTLDLPINYDMFINFHKYFWLVDYMPVCVIEPAINNPIFIDGLVGKIYYTTPVLANDKTLEFKNGMRVSFKGEYAFGNNGYEVGALYIVDGVGDPDGIVFTKQYYISGDDNPFGKKAWKSDTIYTADYKTLTYSETVNPDDFAAREYIVEQRYSIDQSAWARTNLWVREDVVHTACDYNDLDPIDFIIDGYRATRPIIEYRANIEKFNFGKRHILNVDHMFESLNDPELEIVGKITWDLASYTITDEWTERGYKKGDQVRVSMGADITYWDCIGTHGVSKNPTYYENKDYWRKVIAKPLTNGERVLFTNTTTAYSNKMFLVNGVGDEVDGITLSLDYSPNLEDNVTTVEQYDKVLIINGYNSVFFDSYDGYIYSGSEWYWNGEYWIYGQQKEARNGSLKFNLYDTEVIAINDDIVYPLSTFAGDRIFDYARSNGKFDEGLGFSPDYVDYGNNPGFRFDIGLGSTRYYYNLVNSNESYQPNNDASSLEEINGYYYYKRLDNGRYYNGWVNLRNDQPVTAKIRHVITSTTEIPSFDINTTNINLNNKYRFLFNELNEFIVINENTTDENSKYTEIAGTNPVLFMSKNRTYNIQTQFDITDFEFVNIDSTPLSGVVITPIETDLFSIDLSNITVDAFMYRCNSNPDVYGIVYVNSDTATTNLKLYINGIESTDYTIADTVVTLLSTYPVNTTVDLVWYTNDVLTNTSIEYSVADTHVMNPQNEWLSSVTYGDLQNHIKSQMTNIPGFIGEYFGNNNYNKLPHVHEFGGTIRQQSFSTELIAQTLMDVDTNPYAALSYSTQSYAKFKQQLIQKVSQLHKTTPIDIPVYELVDTALTQINLGKPANSMFSNSDMLMYRDYESVNYIFVNGDATVFDLPKTINVYGDKKNHVQVWIKDLDGNSNVTHWRPLVANYDYQLSPDKISINTIISYDFTNRAELHVRWYPINSSSFVPPSAVKLGILKPFMPQVLNNIDINSDGGSGDVIIGHDGSIHKLQYPNQDFVNRSSGAFSIEDATVWELETRIYGNLNQTYDYIIDHNDIMPSANRSTPYSYTDLVAAMEPDFLKWKTRNSISNLSTDDYYDGNNNFTWNYSSVFPFIGGYKGIYTYFFNTERPHTHPWEMLGHNKKPLWWDDAYTWIDTANGGDDAKRTALITALRYGQYNDPAEFAPTYSITYSYCAYDWDANVLVNVDGILNDPVTAGVVTAPEQDKRATPFVFGDYGPIESNWRESSYFHGAKISALMKLRPLWILNSYFDSNRRSLVNNLNIYNHQILFSNTKLLGNNKDADFSYTSYDDSIIEYISVKSGGGGYNASIPVLTIYENFGRDAVATPIVHDGVITAVSVQNPGKQYYSKPSVVVSYGDATFDAFLLKGAKKYFNGLSNAIVEFALFNKTSIEDLQSRFKSLSYTPVIKANGFINPNNQQFILESSQNKGRVVIPEENCTSVLYTTQPDNEIFLGAVKITKTYNGYVINGYDNSKQYFNYYVPNTGTRQTIVTYNNLSVTKYRSYNSIPQRLYYNTTLNSLQAVYDLLLGYGKYLNDQGWADEWTTAAGNFVIWSSTAKIGNTINIIPNATSISVNEGAIGYFDNINNKYDGVYNLIDSNGRQLMPSKTLIVRELLETDNPVTTISSKDGVTQIYGVRLYKVNLEHAVVFDKTTSFDDVIYNAALGQLHTRIIWKGSRTKEWNGRLYSPGYIVNNNTIINNFDTTAREIDQVYAQGAIINNEQALDLARFNAGYNKPDWAIQLNTDNNTAFNFMQGTKKYRGTRFALDAFMRNTSLFGLAANAVLHENWAIRTADYGDTRSRETLEFQIFKNLLKTTPQPIRFSNVDKPDVLTDIVIDIDVNSPLLVTGTPGNNFTTRDPKTYNNATISQEEIYANDFITAGLPLVTEADYKVIDAKDFEAFPTPNKSAYDFSGSWSSITQWDNKTSYKYKDRVIYKGRTWEMLDPDGSSGLVRPNNPIEITGNISLPVIPQSGQTLIIDGNTVTISRVSNATVYNTIVVNGSNDIGTTAEVPHGTTLILGKTSNDATSITFTGSISGVQFNNINVLGDVVNPQIVGSVSKKLTLDGTDILFNETTSATTNITAQAGFEGAFHDSWTIHNAPGPVSIAATARITAFENLRTAYTGTWATFLSTYFTTSDSGLNITALLAEYNATPSYAAEIAALVASDLTIINNIANPLVPYVAVDVLAGTQTVDAGDISLSQIAMDAGVYVNDIKAWLTANLTTVFATTTVVYTLSAGGYKTYVLSEIVNKINAASITNLTASISSNRLLLTKTTTNTAVTFNLTITSASANTEVGITNTTTTYDAVGNVTTTTPNLTISQVIEQINAAGISGITASPSALGSTRLAINSSNTTLYIGSGNANSFIGIIEGQRVASSTVVTVQTTSDLSTIVDAINTASIYGVTARNSNNKLKLVSTNSIMTIGSGTANITVGLTAQTYTATASTVSNVFNAIVGSDGNQVFQQLDHDPNLVSIWVANNSNINEEYNGYAVYQAMDFGMYIMDACKGITAADDAEITVAMPEGVPQAHNLNANDYVLIRGSTTVPSIDGVHRVTSVKDATTFYIDVYLKEEGGTGNIYPLRNVRFSSYDDLVTNYNNKVNGVYKYNFSGYRQNSILKPIYAFVDYDDYGRPAVYRWQGIFDDIAGHLENGFQGWLKVRSSMPQARNDLVNNVRIYDDRKIVVQLETWDPAKGILPGFIEKEIDFKTTADLANYNYDNINGFKDNPKKWGVEQLGVRWWDISTAMYLDYEQGSIDYQQNNWGRLFDGASIDIYEWTQSPVLPDQWAAFVLKGGAVAGEVASGESYYTTLNGEKLYQWTEEMSYNPRTNLTTTTYYFWVKNKITYSNRNNYNIYQLANILRDPGAYDIAWCAASGSDYLFISNVDNYVSDNTVVQINQSYESNALPLNEWTLLSNSNTSVPIPEQLHIKMRDSLVGYNLNTVRYTYLDYSLLDTYSLNDVVSLDNLFYISLTNNNVGNSPAVDTAQNNWRRIYEYSLSQDTEANDIDVVISKALPDLKLHPLNRYGHLIRPQQSLFEDIVEARHNFIEYVNLLLKDICIVSDINNWDVVLNSTFVEGEVTYDMSKYWNYVDWIKREYSVNNELIYEYDPSNLADIIVNSKADLIPFLGDPRVFLEDTYAYVRNSVHKDNINRPEVYRYVNNEWVLVWKKKGTIEFSEELWYQSKFGHGFDTSGFDITGFDSSLGNILGKIFDELRNRIFTGKYRVLYNKLWFVCLDSAVADNTTNDFAFKTTYVDINVEHPILENKTNYQRYTMDAVEQFFHSIKPFHTKLRSSIEAVTYTEINNVEVSELPRNNNITIAFNNHKQREWSADTILMGGNFTDVYVLDPYLEDGYVDVDYVESYSTAIVSNDPLNEDSSTFITPSFDYLYDGHVFVQPSEEGWGAELYPADFTENIRFRVQTNASGDTVDADTRTFQMNYFAPFKLEESIAIVDAAKTTLDGAITADATTILVNSSTALTSNVTAENKGVVWIDNERIEYDAVDGYTLMYCTRGTRGTSSTAHSNNATVIDGGYLYRIPALDNFINYGNGLRMAYNDTGVSLSTTGITPEHAFIRNAGYGTV
jgi:hypothetical protein